MQFFGNEIRPRQPRKAQEGSRDATEKLQNLKHGDAQMDPILFICGLISNPFWGHFGAQQWHLVSLRFLIWVCLDFAVLLQISMPFQFAP